MWRRIQGLTIVFVPEEEGESRSLRISGNGMRTLLIGGAIAAILFIFMVVTWWYLALTAARNWEMEALVDSLQGERAQVLSLAEELSRVETEYEHLRTLFGSDTRPSGSDLWLPPSGLPGGGSPNRGAGPDSHLPTVWPLTEPGFVTQPLIEGGEADHPGLDIAVPSDSYVRASGGGLVVRTGEDPLYGMFVVLEHDDGYQTVYAHVSNILVSRGQTVRQTEVIALSGSTGRSTAPHLHFEILLEGTPIDPLTLVEKPQ